MAAVAVALFGVFLLASPLPTTGGRLTSFSGQAPVFSRNVLGDLHLGFKEHAYDAPPTCSWGVGPVKGLPEYRTGFHFQAPRAWLNDPNGPMYYKAPGAKEGYYHIFYQHNPAMAIWGNITWGHAVSRDLLSWAHLPIAFRPSDAIDVGGVWTGSATAMPDGKPAMLYTCAGEGGSPQLVCLGTPKNSSDPLLLEWEKSPANPVVKAAPPNVPPQLFRDPSSAWQGADGAWRMLVGAQVRYPSGATGGAALVYKGNSDFTKWDLDSELLAAQGSPMWECPDLFPLPPAPGVVDPAAEQNSFTPQGFPVLPLNTTGLSPGANASLTTYVLKASVLDRAGFSGRDKYVIGQFDRTSGKFITSRDYTADIRDLRKGPRLDYGIFYASKTQYDPVHSRRILWGWVREGDSPASALKRGWAGIMSLPREVHRDPTATRTGHALLLNPIAELASLRGRRTALRNATLAPRSFRDLTSELPGLCGTSFDLLLEFAVPPVPREQAAAVGPFGIRVMATEDGEEATSVWFKLSVGRAGLGEEREPLGLAASPPAREAIDLEPEEPVDVTAIPGEDDRRLARGATARLTCANDMSRSSRAPDVDRSVQSGPLRLAPGDTSLKVRVVLDRSAVETYWQGGRAAITSRVYPTRLDATRFVLFNDGHVPVHLRSLEAFELKPAPPLHIPGAPPYRPE